MKRDLREEQNLKEAIGLYRKHWSESLPTEEELEKTITVSPELDRRIMELIHGEEKKKRSWLSRNHVILKAAACVAVVLCVGTAVFFSAYGDKGRLQQFHEYHPNIHGEIPKGGESESETMYSTFDFEGTVMLPSYIPEDFILIEVDGGKTDVHHMYQSSTNLFLNIHQNIIGTARPLDLDESKFESVSITDTIEGIYYAEERKSYLFFETDQYIFNINGVFYKEELIKIAQSMLE